MSSRCPCYAERSFITRGKPMNPRNRQCAGKVKHSEGKARAHLRHLIEDRQADPATLRVYVCGRCGYWHVGHKSRQQQEMERAHGMSQ